MAAVFSLLGVLQVCWEHKLSQETMRRLLRCGAFLTAAVAVHLAPSTPRQLHRASIGPAVRRHASSRITALAAGPAAAEEVVQRVHLPTNEESDELLRIRHTSAHVMAMAVQRLFKDAKVTIGPWIEKGFYYDFDMPLDAQLEDKDLKKIKKEMDKIIQRKLPLVREEVDAAEAERRIRAAGEEYKLEILQSIVARDATAPITIYHIGEPAVEGEEPKGGLKPWWDLCAGPHVEHTGLLPKDAISLESIAGAYWRGDEKRPMLQRVYGTAWQNAAQRATSAVSVVPQPSHCLGLLGRTLQAALRTSGRAGTRSSGRLRCGREPRPTPPMMRRSPVRPS